MKRTVVVDASVVAKAFFTESHSEAARRLLSAGGRLMAPDLIRAEFANVVWKRARADQITSSEATEMIDNFLSLPLELISSEGLLRAALELAVATDRTVYDCFYLALAIDRQCPLITGDERFVNALSRSPCCDHVKWIGGMA